MSSCPCGFGEPYDQCCGRYHRGAADPPTAAAVMRARYAAFAVGDEAFLIRTGPDAAGGLAAAGGLLDADTVWTSLFLTGSSGGGLLEDRGTVEFVARYVRAGRPGVLRENSRFGRVDGRWRYLGPTSGAADAS